MPTSLASERLKPSSARWAMAAPSDSASSGSAPMTTTRPHDSSWRSTGEKNSCNDTSPCVESMLDASKTRPLYFIESARTPVASIRLDLSAAVTALAIGVWVAAPVSTVPFTSGAALVALEVRGVRQAQVLDQELADRVVGQVLVTIRHDRVCPISRIPSVSERAVKL